MAILDEVGASIRQLAEGAGTSVVGVGQRWGVGSGIVLDEGKVLTNAHNVRGDRVTVTFADGRTAEGAGLAGALRLLAHWGTRHTDQADAPRHLTCGTPIEARWYCPTCDQLVDHEPRHAQVHYV